MDQAWFEMEELRKKSIDSAVWVPLRWIGTIALTGSVGRLGFRQEFIDLAALAVPHAQATSAKSLSWEDVNLRSPHRGGTVNGQYVPADEFRDDQTQVSGVWPVLVQQGNGQTPPEWHLHQDLVITLGLKREGDIWVAIDEGYIEVARLRREQDRPILLEIRAEHFKDYLCARKMGLLVSSYHSREEITEDATHILWPTAPAYEEAGPNYLWEGWRREIHEGGMPFGSSFAAIRLGRADSSEEDIPTISSGDENITCETQAGHHSGRKLVRVEGRLWKKDWVSPSSQSQRVGGDDVSPSVSFLTDNKGTRETCDSLTGGGRWLWFKPGIIMCPASAGNGEGVLPLR